MKWPWYISSRFRLCAALASVDLVIASINPMGFMSLKMIRFLLVLATAFMASELKSKAEWVQSSRSGQVAYFLFNASPRVERFALTNDQWLSPLALPSTYGLPTRFHVDADGIYVAYGQSVVRYDLAGNNETHLLNTVDSVEGIYTDGNLILINHTSSSYARFTSIDKATGMVIDQFENYIDSIVGAAIAPAKNKIIGRSVGVSPSDITYVSYNDDGAFVSGGDSPHHGDYPRASHTWVFPGEAKVVDDSGTVYSTADLTYLNSLGGKVDDLDFYGPDIPIVLRESQLIAYSNTLLPTGSSTLTFNPKKIYVVGTNVLAFTPERFQTNGIRVETIPICTLKPATPGKPVDPNGLAYTPDDAFLDRNGVLYLFSKTYQSLFRWDTSTQKYLVSIPLVEVPSYAAYSPSNHAVYLAYSSGMIRQIDLNSTNLTETPFAILATVPGGLSTADTYVFAMDYSGAWATHYTFDRSGTKIEEVDWNYYSKEFVWSSVNQKMYFLRDDTSPNDLLWERINANGQAYTNEPPGGIGGYQDSPLHGSEGFAHPIRVAPDGTIVLLGTGVMHDANSLARLAISLGNSITDAAWVDGGLRTIRTIASVAQFQQWTLPSYGLGTVRQVPGQAHRLFALESGKILAITMQGGQPSFYITDSNFNILAPPVLEAPGGLLARLVSDTQVELTWFDVSGEVGYSIERKQGTGGNWTEIGVTTNSVTQFRDGAVMLDNDYTYRVVSKNGSQTSEPSVEVAVRIAAPDVPANFQAVKLSSSSISLTWSDVANESSYYLERKIGADGCWTQIRSLAANTSADTDVGLAPNTEYFYRLRAHNGIGTSAYSMVQSAITDPVLPTSPYLVSAIAYTAFSVYLEWYESQYQDSYIIERRTGVDGDWLTLAVVGRDASWFMDGEVNPLTTYQYRMYATNTLGASMYSGIREVTTPEITPPSAPDGLAAKAISISTIFVFWDDVLGETGYRLERRNDDPHSWMVVATLPADATSYTDTNLLEGVQYFYRVQAFNSAGSSSYSNEHDAVPVNIVTFIHDDFDAGADPLAWANIRGGVVTNGGQGFPGNQALWFGAAGTRSATTIPLDMTYGGDIEFRFRAGNGAVDGTIFWDNSEYGDGVVLEYSHDGIQWSVMEFFDTEYPQLSNWISYSIPISEAARGRHVQIRWRQLAHSGAGYDTWALDTVRVVGVAPVLPEAPPFILSSPSSATSIALLWIEGEGAATYIIERRQGTNAWVPLVTLPASIKYYTDTTALPATAYSYRVQARNVSGASPYSLVTTSVTLGQMAEWLLVNYGNPEAMTEQELSSEAPDGTRPLLRYAFNLSADEPARTLVPGESTSGFPVMWFDRLRQRLCVEFIRRKASTNPGIIYDVQFSGELSEWKSAGHEVSTAPIDAIWERVRYEDGADAGTLSIRFGRVTVRRQ